MSQEAFHEQTDDMRSLPPAQSTFEHGQSLDDDRDLRVHGNMYIKEAHRMETSRLRRIHSTTSDVRASPARHARVWKKIVVLNARETYEFYRRLENEIGIDYNNCIQL